MLDDNVAVRRLPPATFEKQKSKIRAVETAAAASSRKFTRELALASALRRQTAGAYVTPSRIAFWLPCRHRPHRAAHSGTRRPPPLDKQLRFARGIHFRSTVRQRLIVRIRLVAGRRRLLRCHCRLPRTPCRLRPRRPTRTSARHCWAAVS
jgi:hypothetical protein